MLLGQMGSSDVIMMGSSGGGGGSPMRGGKMVQNDQNGIGRKSG